MARRVTKADKRMVNCTCKDFRLGNIRRPDYVVLAVEVMDAREITIKKGQNEGKQMAFLMVADETGPLEDVTMFSDAWSQFGGSIWFGCRSSTHLVMRASLW